jgi:hypothetical protein
VISDQEIGVFIDGLARGFENRPHVSPEVPNGIGWGQFLDGPPQQTQIGPYGTCAGLIVRALAGRGPDQMAERVGEILSFWWGQKETQEEERKLFAQTTRVAVLLLALRIANLQSTSAVLEQVHQYLLSTLLPSKMWGNYTVPELVEDPSPRLFPTAIALLSFALFREDSSPLPNDLTLCADKLEERLLGTKDLPLLHIAAASAAILAVKNGDAGKKIRKHISKLAYATQATLPELGAYFYDLEIVKTNNGAHDFHRDYLIVPTEILLGIAGFQRGAPAYLRLRAESSLNALVKNLGGFGGFYRPDNEARVSSVNQCWVAMYLALGMKDYSGPAWWSRLTFWLLKQRPDAFWIDAILLTLCAGGILLAGVTNFPVMSARSFTIKSAAAALAFIAGRLYAPTFLKKIFVGRE